MFDCPPMSFDTREQNDQQSQYSMHINDRIQSENKQSKWHVLSDLLTEGVRKKKRTQLYSPDQSTLDVTIYQRPGGMGLKTLKTALDKTYETLNHEKEVFKAFSTGNKPPQKFSDPERELIFNAVMA